LNGCCTASEVEQVVTSFSAPGTTEFTSLEGRHGVGCQILNLKSHPLKIGILANEGSWYYRDLDRAARASGHDCVRLDFARLIACVDSAGTGFRHASPRAIRRPQSIAEASPSPIDEQSGAAPGNLIAARCDVVVVRTMAPGSLEQVVYRMDHLGLLEVAGTRIVNSPRSLECAVDKFLTTARLQQAGLPVPATIVCEHEDDALAAFHQLGGDVVVKPLFGSEGRGIVRVSDPDLAHRTFRTLMRLQAVLYLQRFVDHGGFDVRILVLGDRVLGGMRRRSPNDFRTNVAREAIAEPHEPTLCERDLALRAARITGTYMAGIDLLYDRDGTCYVIEVNAVPGWQAFGRVTGMDVAACLIDQLASHG
jgi:RimK family alpha-L-glutamate ligase